jgi:hypothetical protein
MAQSTSQEWYMLALVNRMRTKPQEELDLLLNSGDSGIDFAIQYFNVDLDLLADQWSQLSAVAPLAWSNLLNDSAETHNDLMIEYDQQSHNLPNEPGLGTRISNAGYTGWNRLSESIFAFADSVFYGHAAFSIDWGFSSTGIQEPPGHRNAIMNASFRDLGIAITPEDDPSTSVGPLVITQHFGSQFASSSRSILLGSVFDDLDNDGFYDPGEGVDDVTIDITGINGTTFDQSWTSDMMGTGVGGYQVQLNPGQYEVDFIRSGNMIKSETITVVSGVNQQLDALVAEEIVAIDLVGSAFDVVHDHVLAGEAAVTFTLENQGTHSAGAFTVNVVYSEDSILGNEDDQIISEVDYTGLDSQEAISDSFAVQLPLSTDDLTGLNDRALVDDGPGMGDGYVSVNQNYIGIVIDAEDSVFETNELNNAMQGKGIDMDDITYFPWDIDSSGLVTPTDAIYVINRLGQSTSSDNKLADFDGSGSITPTDAISAINRLGYGINSDVIEISA